MKNKLFLLSIFVFLLCVASAFAVGTAPSDNDVDLYYKMEDSSTTIVDATSNNNDGSLTGTGWTNQNSGIINFGLRSDDIGDYIDLGTPLLNSTSDWTYNTWFKYNGNCAGTAENIVFISQYESGSDGRFLCRAISGTSSSLSCGPVGGWSMSPSWTCDNDWHMVTLRHEDDVNVELFLDGEVIANVTETGAIYTGINTRIGEVSPWGIESNIDESSFYGGVLLTLDNIDFLYNAGSPTSDQQYPFYTPVIEINDSTESTAVVKQIGSVSFANGMTTILSSDFNVSVNNTPLYGGYSFNVASQSNNLMYCELLIDGVVRANVTRSQTAGSTGSVFIQTQDFLIDEGTYTQELQCQRIGGVGLITVSNAVGIGHFLINQDLDFIPYNSTSFDSISVTSGASYTLLDSFNLTIGNYTEVDESQNRTNHIVIESKITYTNLNVGDELLSAYVSVVNSSDIVNCSMYPRYVATGNTGSVSMDCFVANVTTNQTYTINIYANGSNAEYTSNTIAKNFFLSEGEIVGGTGAFVGLAFSGDSFTPLAVPASAGNLNHDVANVFTKLSYAIETDLDTTVSIYFNLSDGTDYQTFTWERDFTAGETGVIIGHDILENVAKDANYTVQVYANCGTVGANCTIVGGQTGGYITDVITTFLNAFNVSAFDYWDNSSISNFTVIDGGTWSSVDGSAFVFTSENPENLTITSSTHFSEVVLNHNTSTDLNVSLKNSDIKFSVTELITGISLSDFLFTVDGITKNGTESFYLKAGSYTVTANSTDYFDLVTDVNVTSLQNTTVNLDGAFNGIINVSVTDRINDITIQNFSGVSSYDLLGLNISLGSFSTTNYTYSIPALSDYTFYVALDPISGLSSFGNTAEFNVGAKEILNYTFLLYTNNSINFSFQDLATLNPLAQNVNISLVGSTVTYNFNTSTGFLYVDDLNDDTYTSTFSTSGYDPVVLFLTLGNNGHLNTVVSFDTGLLQKTFNVQDNNLNPVPDATITFYVNINGTQTVFGQARTDFSGTSTILLDESLEYTFVAQKDSYVTFTGKVTPTEDSYTITMNTVGEDIFTSVFDDVVYTPVFFYDADTGVINSSLVISSSQGSLEFYGLFTDYTGSREVFNVSSSPQGGVANVVLTNITDPSNRTITFTYFFKSSGYDIFAFNQSYYLTNITVNDTSLTGGLFNDIQDLDADEPVRGFIGAVIVLVGVLLFISTSRNFTVGVIGGVLAVGVNWYFGIWPAATSLISVVVAIILIIADNTRG